MHTSTHTSGFGLFIQKFNVLADVDLAWRFLFAVRPFTRDVLQLNCIYGCQQIKGLMQIIFIAIKRFYVQIFFLSVAKKSFYGLRDEIS